MYVYQWIRKNAREPIERQHRRSRRGAEEATLGYIQRDFPFPFQTTTPSSYTLFFRETQETKYSTLNLIALWKKSTICWEKEIFKWWGMCPWICWNKESLIVYGARGAQTPWVVLEKELETSLLNSTTALMDQHQLNHQFCGQSQHTQHIQQKKQKKELFPDCICTTLYKHIIKRFLLFCDIFLFLLSSRFGSTYFGLSWNTKKSS